MPERLRGFTIRRYINPLYLYVYLYLRCCYLSVTVGQQTDTFRTLKNIEVQCIIN